MGEDFANDVTVNVGQTSMRTIVIIGQPLMVQAEEMQDGRVEVMDVHHVFDGLVAEFIGRAEAETSLHARTGQPRGETLRVMVATFSSFLKRRHPAEFRGPEDERIIQQSTRFQVDQKRRARAVEDRTVPIVVRLDPPVTVPSLRPLLPSRMRR